jgi:uncharacterized radical SAM protein YgiQ
MYGSFCRKKGRCRRHDCLWPSVCKNLEINSREFVMLLADVSGVRGVKRVLVSSGLRMDMLLEVPDLLKEVVLRYQPGAIKIAPEHTSDRVLRLMHKPGNMIFRKFINVTRKISGMVGKKVYFTPYIISSHPGCTVNDMKRLGRDLHRLGIKHVKVQDFTPVPGTLSTAMYVTSLDRYGKNTIHVARNRRERLMQRRIVEQCKG